jgi:small ligand-binding sensory domain FIST
MLPDGMSVMGEPATQSSGAYSELMTGAFDEARVEAASHAAYERLGGTASIAFLFVSADYEPALPDLIELVQIHARCPLVVGCSAGGFIGVGHEEEDAHGFSLLVLRLPNAEVSAFDLPPDAGGAAWDRAKRWNREGCTGWIVLGNPVHVGEDWMTVWNEAIGSTPTYGGLASGSFRGEELFIFTSEGVSKHASVAIGFRGGVKLHGIVSQGCRPIGEPLTITKADQNLIHQLASRSAYDQLQAAFHSLPDAMRENAQGNILVGLAMSEYVEDFHTGDFLVRSILGGDPGNGILAVGALPRVGQTLQFQLRDREAAHEELRDMLAALAEELGRSPFATLLFSCAGRGKHLFGTPHHDAAQFQEAFGAVPLAGYFCNGEIGSVGARAYLHGFTASGVAFVEA